jgi:uncharacterized protein YdhG (YjbR/CyaY superfamily)
MATFTTVDEYIAALPDDVRLVLEGLRRSIRSVVPDVDETISYQMPTFTFDGKPLVHVAAWKRHVGLYPLPPMDEPLASEVAPYRGAQDAMQLTYAEPIPYDLVERVVAVLLQRRMDGGSPADAAR